MTGPRWLEIGALVLKTVTPVLLRAVGTRQ